MASPAPAAAASAPAGPNKLRKRVVSATRPADRKPDGRGSAAGSPPKKARPQWLLWALASGGFAAFNGVFAKLTTAGRTQQLAVWLARITGSVDNAPVFEVIARIVFFGLNLLSNAVMWFLFTRALTAATSTTRVSILNTTANFLVTAVLGMAIFGEHLPLGWWCGAALLVAGSVIIGAREGKEGEAAAQTEQDQGRIALPADPLPGEGGTAPYKDQPANITVSEEPVELRR